MIPSPAEHDTGVKHMKDTVIASIEQHKIIAILRGIPDDRLIPLAQALYRGGIRLLEVTYSADGSTPDTVIADRIRRLSACFAGRMHIGAGTVLTEQQVCLTKEAGGQFIISPDTRAVVIRKSAELGLVSIPGAFTPTEIAAARDLGADFVKLFPVTSLGPAYVKAVSAPLSHVKLLAVGGIDLSNLQAYLRAGVRGFGISSSLTDKTMIANEDWDGITRLAESYTAVIQNG